MRRKPKPVEYPVTNYRIVPGKGVYEMKRNGWVLICRFNNNIEISEELLHDE